MISAAANALEDDYDFKNKVISVFDSAAVTVSLAPVIEMVENNISKRWFSIVEQVEQVLTACERV